jgi:electron transfer flavoprotein beta subunit
LPPSAKRRFGVNILVCVKQIFDPDIPAAKFRIDERLGRVIPPEGLPPVVNPYDAQAVELALRLKEKEGGKIAVLTVGDSEAGKALKHALSMGADEAFLLDDPAFEGSDRFSIAHILVKAIRKTGGFDLVLCGRQAADWDEGLVGSLIAEMMGLPLVTLAAGIEAAEGKLIVRRATLDGYQVFEIDPPAVVTVSNEVGQPRLPSGWGIIAAARKQIPVWKLGDIGADPSMVGQGAARRRLVRLSMAARERKCEMVKGETAVEASAALAAKMREAGIL